MTTRPVFADLWITLQHFRDAASGLDPLSDPNSEFAYPRAVLLLRYLRLHELPAEWLGGVQGILLTLCIIAVMQPRTWRRAIGTCCLVLSPGIVLGLERGNFDCLMFLLCAGAAWLWAQTARMRNLPLPIVVLSVGAAMKLYPVFGLCAGAIAEKGRRRALWAAATALVLAYWWLNRAELALIAQKVPTYISYSWGSFAFFARVEWYMERHRETFGALSAMSWKWVGLAAYAALAAVAMRRGLRMAPHFSRFHSNNAEWAYFWMGAVICCGCFIGSNVAYRWVFAVFTLPLLLRSIRSTERAVATWGRATLGTLIISVGAPLRPEGIVFVVIQATNWAYILLLLVGCTAMRLASAGRVAAYNNEHQETDAVAVVGRTT